MISIFGNKIVVTDDKGRRTAEIAVAGSFTVKTFPGGDDPSDDGRDALLSEINASLSTCGNILAGALVEVNMAQGLSYKKAAALRGMIDLFKEMSVKLIPDIHKYAKYEDASEYDETIVEVGVRKICEAIFSKGSPTLNSCLDLLDEANATLRYPCREDFSKCPLNVPLPYHRVAEWFAPGDGNEDVSAILQAATADIKKTIHVDGNYTRQLFRFGAEEKNARDRRSPKQRRFLDELVQKYREKTRKQGGEFKKSEFYRDAFKTAPSGLFRDATHLRHVLEYDEGHFYT